MAAFPGVGLSSALLKLEWPCPHWGSCYNVDSALAGLGLLRICITNPLLVRLVILMLPVPGPLLEYHLLIKGGN